MHINTHVYAYRVTTLTLYGKLFIVHMGMLSAGDSGSTESAYDSVRPGTIGCSRGRMRTDEK